MIYNHGFVVKTPEVVFAFDLVSFPAVVSDWYPVLPNDIVEQIDALFVTHEHPDHYAWNVVNRLAWEDYVVVPSGMLTVWQYDTHGGRGDGYDCRLVRGRARRTAQHARTNLRGDHTGRPALRTHGR